MYLVVQKDPAPAGEGVPRGAEWGNDLTDDDLTLTPRTYPQRSFLVNNFFSGRSSALFFMLDTRNGNSFGSGRVEIWRAVTSLRATSRARLERLGGSVLQHIVEI